jgi:hypothetical protein
MPKASFVKGSGMAEIKANKRLVERLRKGSQDAKRKNGTLADHRSRSYGKAGSSPARGGVMERSGVIDN